MANWIVLSDGEFGEEPWIKHCPCEIETEPYGTNFDKETIMKRQISEDNYDVIGCRGVTCEECWNQESEEE